MIRLICILVLLTLAAVPAARAMDHAHHSGHGSERSVSPAQEATMPALPSCKVADSTDRPMPGHGSCLGCCPGNLLQGNVSPTPRGQDALTIPEFDDVPAFRSDDVPVSSGARSPGLVCGDFCPVLRL